MLLPPPLQAQRAAGVLASLGVSDAYIWADISSRAQDTAKILAQELDIRQVTSAAVVKGDRTPRACVVFGTLGLEAGRR